MEREVHPVSSLHQDSDFTSVEFSRSSRYVLGVDFPVEDRVGWPGMYNEVGPCKVTFSPFALRVCPSGHLVVFDGYYGFPSVCPRVLFGFFLQFMSVNYTSILDSPIVVSFCSCLILIFFLLLLFLV